eukprot:1529065-Rhodomonas_salina.1
MATRKERVDGSMAAALAVRGPMVLRACYAISGTDVAYDATRRRGAGWAAVLAPYLLRTPCGMLLRAPRTVPVCTPRHVATHALCYAPMHTVLCCCA